MQSEESLGKAKRERENKRKEIERISIKKSKLLKTEQLVKELKGSFHDLESKLEALDLTTSNKFYDVPWIKSLGKTN